MKPCENCDGTGWRFQAPRGVNTFLCSIEQLEKILRRVQCWACRGTGKRPTPEDTP